MTVLDEIRCDDTLRQELGMRAFAAIGNENASSWNTEWEIEGRCFRAMARPLADAVAA